MTKLLFIEQRSPEWHRLRANSLGSSDSPIIMGLSPYCTIRELYDRKKGEAKEQFVSKAMQKGIDQEPEALRWLNANTRRNFVSVVGAYEPNERLIASLDGYCAEENLVAEIKCSKAICADAANGFISKMYLCQMQHQMLVFGAQVALFVAFDGFDGNIIEVRRDEAFIDEMLKAELEFLDMLDNDLAPPSDEPEHIQVIVEDEELVYDFVATREQLKYLKKVESDQKAAIEALGDSGNFELVSRAGRPLLRLTRTNPAGLVDWSALCKKFNISDEEVNSFRKPQIGFYKYQVLNK